MSRRRIGTYGLQQRSRGRIFIWTGNNLGRTRTISFSQISAPTDFQHVAHNTFDFSPDGAQGYTAAPSPIQRPRRVSYRPLELSICLPDNALSPLWPHLGLAAPSPVREECDEDTIIALPPAAVLASNRDDAYILSHHQRSNSDVTLHVPRRTKSESCSRNRLVKDQHDSVSARRRSLSAAPVPSISSLVQRIASAFEDLDQLQGKIKEVNQQQSTYCNIGKQSIDFSLFQQCK